MSVDEEGYSFYNRRDRLTVCIVKGRSITMYKVGWGRITVCILGGGSSTVCIVRLGGLQCV